MTNQTLALSAVLVVAVGYTLAQPKQKATQPVGSSQATIEPERIHAPEGTDAAGSVVVTWMDSITEARQIAGQRTILAVMTGPNCGPCEVLTKNLEDPAIQSLLAESCVCVRTDWRGLGFKKPQPIPALFFDRPGLRDGEEIKSHTPPTNVVALLTLLEQKL